MFIFEIAFVAWQQNHNANLFQRHSKSGIQNLFVVLAGAATNPFRRLFWGYAISTNYSTSGQHSPIKSIPFETGHFTIKDAQGGSKIAILPSGFFTFD